MKIISLEVSNVKRLKAISITPKGSMITVGGKNGSGKTSTLDSIRAAFGGAAELGRKPIRNGEDEANIDIDLGDILVHRNITARGTTLEVTSKDGAKYPSPQAMLDKLTGKISFDPLSFQRLEPKKQLAALQKVVGLDVSQYDAKRAKLFDERSDVNKLGKAAKIKYDEMPNPEALDEEVSVSELTARVKEADAANKAADTFRRGVDSIDRRIAEIKKRETELRDELLDLEEQSKNYSKEKIEVEGKLSQIVRVDTAPILTEINAAEDVNKAVRAKRARADAAKALEVLRNDSAKLTAQIQEVDDAKAAALAGATFPVPGLSFGEDGITFNGVPFEQCSGAEQLRISVAMGIALNPQIKVLLVNDGSLLDEESLRTLGEMAEEAGAQVWVEIVSDNGAGVSVFIEDGEIVQPAVEAAE
jgi:DNA repair exonuclease SbcCD ATPase subunit